MITVRELNYVNAPSHVIPYPGKDYASEALRKLANSEEDFNRFYSNKEYDIVLSNGEQLIFEILDKNLCHMLGIDHKGIMNNSFCEEFRYDVLNIGNEQHVRSYDFLLSIINNLDKVLEYEEETRKRILNYYRIMIKCSIFEKLSNFTDFNFGVINFDKDEYLKHTDFNFSSRSNKLFYVQTNEIIAPYFMMGLLPDSDSDGKYAVETLIAPAETKNFFNNQEVVIPTQILVTTEESMDKFEATSQEKIALLNQYKSIINEYGLLSKLNIYGDYESLLVEQSQTRVRK